MNIKTEHVFPPIPTRRFDWMAYDDNLGADCSPIGRGATEQEAIANLREQLRKAEYCECPQPMLSRSQVCDFCGKEVEPQQCCGEEMQTVAVLRGSTFVFEGWRCNKCSNAYGSDEYRFNEIDRRLGQILARAERPSAKGD